MAELTAADLAAYTRDRLEDGDETQALLDAALVCARRYCGWSVCPVITVTLTLDGPGISLLSLPSLHVLSVASVVENGVTLDVSSLDVSQDKGTIEKYPHGCWTSRAGAVAVTMTHGFTESEAADWRRAVLSFADRMSVTDSSGDPIQVGPFRWSEVDGLFNATECAVFDRYRILPSP